jgi:hypothetical protein
MSQKVTYQEGNTLTAEEAVLNALEGKEGLLVSINTAGKAVLFDGTIPAVGVYQGRLQPGSPAVSIRLLGKNGTVRLVQNAAINPGVRVTGVSANARVVAATTGTRSVGIKLSPFTGAAGDVIEVSDLVEHVP